MAKKLLLLIPLMLVIAGIALAVPANITKVNNGGLMDKKVLVAYFSWSGNTKSIAEKIHKRVGGDIFSIEPVTPYEGDYNEVTYGIAREQVTKGIHPGITNTDISSYDVIFVGTPVWWYKMAPPVATFLAENNFEGKIVVPFVTHGGGGGYSIDKDMAQLAKGANVLSSFVVYGKGNFSTDKELAEWLNGLEF